VLFFNMGKFNKMQHSCQDAQSFRLFCHLMIKSTQMDTRVTKSILAGIIGTAVMSFIMTVAPMMGIPEMNPPAMLAGMMGMPIAVGWLIHFVIGIVFAALYVFLFAPRISMKNKIIKGSLFGIVAFVLAQVGMMALELVIGDMPTPNENMLGMLIGSIMGHVVFGIFVALSAKD